MYKIRLLFIIFNFCSLLIVAQKSEGTYEIVRQNTDNKFLAFSIIPVKLLVSGSRFDLSADADLKVYLKGLFINTNVNYSYLNIAPTLSDGLIFAESKSINNAKNFDINVGYFFEKKVNDNVRIKLANIGTSMMPGEKYTLIKADYTKFKGIQGGVKKGNTTLILSEGLSGGYKVTYADSSNQSSYDATSPSVTNLHYTWISFGGSIGNTKDIEVVFSKYGKRRVTEISRFYFNVIYVLYSRVDDIYEIQTTNSPSGQSQASGSRYIIDKSILSNAGLNIGYEFTNNRKFGDSFGIECGLLPGQKNVLSNIYLSVKYGVAIGAFFNKQ
jgi:hypothetical protein